MWILTWLLFWFTVMGLPNYLFKKYKITYYENSWQHTLFFITSSVLLFWVYKSYLPSYFNEFNLTHLITTLVLFLFWIFVPFWIYKDDYYEKTERFNYQLPKFFDIIFQQLCILSGLLTFGVSPFVFGVMFFMVHVPILILIPKRFMLLPVFGSLVGGIIFAYLQSQGLSRILIALFIHLLFWLIAHYLLSNRFFGMVPIKR